jgi:hypothetical protein
MVSLLALFGTAILAAMQSVKGSAASRIYAAALAIAAIYLVAFAFYWDLVGFTV